jgi:hypothetical protein
VIWPEAQLVGTLQGASASMQRLLAAPFVIRVPPFLVGFEGTFHEVVSNRVRCDILSRRSTSFTVECGHIDLEQREPGASSRAAKVAKRLWKKSGDERAR